MMEAIVVMGLIVAGLVAGAFVMMVIGIHIEDGRKSVTTLPSDPISAGTRRFLRLYVDHTSCLYVTHPEHACPICRRAYSVQR